MGVQQTKSNGAWSGHSVIHGDVPRHTLSSGTVDFLLISSLTLERLKVSRVSRSRKSISRLLSVLHFKHTLKLSTLSHISSALIEQDLPHLGSTKVPPKLSLSSFQEHLPSQLP